MTAGLDLADRHREETIALTGAAYRRARRAWRRVEPGHIVSSWQAQLPAVVAAITTAQMYSAIDAQAYSLASMEARGLNPDGPLIDPRALAGTMPKTGATVAAAAAGVGYHVLDLIGAGAPPARALAAGSLDLGRIVQLAVADTSRTMSSATIATRKQRMGWIRVVRPGCCPRCSILAGRFYRWNAGFERHPRCLCEHLAAGERSEHEVTHDPYEAFMALSSAEQDRLYTKAGAAAIRDGADIYQVVNSRFRPMPEGLTRSRRFTTEGTSARRGYFRRQSTAGQAGYRRLTVEEIYRRADGSRPRAMEMLRDYGFITEQGQVAGGAIVGDREGFGQYGRGGRRAGARSVVEQSIRTGQRDPQSIYTMTAAELRAFHAAQRAA